MIKFLKLWLFFSALISCACAFPLTESTSSFIHYKNESGYKFGVDLAYTKGKVIFNKPPAPDHGFSVCFDNANEAGLCKSYVSVYLQYNVGSSDSGTIGNNIDEVGTEICKAKKYTLTNFEVSENKIYECQLITNNGFQETEFFSALKNGENFDEAIILIISVRSKIEEFNVRKGFAVNVIKNATLQ